MTHDAPSRILGAHLDRAPRGLEEVYESCTPLLLSALGRLIRSGYRLDPSMGLDLVHDFYLEQLPGLFERYDHTKAQFSTYLYAAFLKYARPRIIRNMRLEGLMSDLERYPASSTEAEPEFPDRLTEATEQAFEELPHDSRAVLKARIVDGLSERDTARRLKLSRYFVRQHLAEALGRLAVAIGQDALIPEDVRPLAVRVWRDEQPLMEAAGDLDWSRAEALSRYRELLRRIGAGLGKHVK